MKLYEEEAESKNCIRYRRKNIRTEWNNNMLKVKVANA